MSKKKSFNPLDRGNLKLAAEDFKDQIEDTTRGALEKFDKEPSSENYQIVVDEVKYDSLLSDSQKNQILESIENSFLALMNDTSYKTKSLEYIEKEISFLQEKGKQLVYMIGERLFFIQDEIEKFKNGDYSRLGAAVIKQFGTFENYIEEKFGIRRRTGYDYIDIAKYYGVRTSAQERIPDYTKLSPFFPILNYFDKLIESSESTKEKKSWALEEKNKIISHSLEYCLNHTVKESRENALKKKIELGLKNGISKNKTNDYKKFKKQAILLFNNEISEEDIVDLKSLLIRLDNHFNLNICK